MAAGAHRFSRREKRFALLSLFLGAAAGFCIELFVGRVSFLDDPLFDAAAGVHDFLTESPDEDVAVIGLDADSLRSPPINDIPRALMGPVWARLTQTLVDAGASVVAYDFIFAFSGDRFVPGHDQSFRTALGRNADKAIIGRAVDLTPARGFVFALRRPDAIALLELPEEADGAVRRMPPADIEGVASLSTAAAARMGVEVASGERWLTPSRHPRDVPTWSVIDILKCGAENPAALAEAFAGKAVFVGTTLPAEDQKPNVYRGPIEKASATAGEPPCAPKPPARGQRTLPGVFLHAAAVRSHLTGGWSQIPGKEVRLLIATLFGAFGAAVAWGGRSNARLGRDPVVWIFVSVLSAAGAVTVVALRFQIYWPPGSSLIACALSFLTMTLMRFAAVEQRRTKTEQAFGKYLAPQVIAAYVDGDAKLAPGGEEKDVTVMFADLAGFTAASPRLTPQELLVLTNAYLGLIVEAVEARGGYIDKFIGDAVMAVWGMPLHAKQGPLEALEAVVAAQTAVTQRAAADEHAGRPSFRARFGLAHGPAVIGNVGTLTRLNYTAIGKTVNMASRYEGLADHYRSGNAFPRAMAAPYADRFLLRTLDHVMVKGAADPVDIAQVVSVADDPDASKTLMLSDYAEALDRHRARDFKAAVALWARHEEADGPSRVMAERARAYMTSPPPHSWNGVHRMTGKS